MFQLNLQDAAERVASGTNYVAGYIAALETRIAKLEELFSIIGVETTFMERFLELEQRVDTLDSEVKDKVDEETLDRAIENKIDTSDCESLIEERVSSLLKCATISIEV